MTDKKAIKKRPIPNNNQIKKRNFSKIISQVKIIRLGIEVLFVLVFIFIAIYILYSSIDKYYSLDNDTIFAQNQHLISSRVTFTAYRLKVYADFLIISIPKYQDDLNNVHKYGSTLHNNKLSDWAYKFEKIKLEVDSTISLFKNRINNIYPRPTYYDKLIVYFDAAKNDIIKIFNELESMQGIGNILLGLEDKYTFNLIKLSGIMADTISEYSVEKAFAKSKLFNIQSEKSQQLLNILASILTLCFIYITISQFEIFKRTKKTE